MDPVLAQLVDGVLHLTLNRPDRRNAVNKDMVDQLIEHLEHAESDPGVRAVLISGAGGTFCSGGDLAEPAAQGEGLFSWMRLVGKLIDLCYHLPIPTIALVEGAAYGLGCNLAFACDFTVASDTARFREVFSARGLTVDGGGTWLLPRLVGIKRAKEIALLGEAVSAQNAQELGLVTRVVAPGELGAAGSQLAARLATGATLALAMTKSMLDNSYALTLEQALEQEAESQVLNARTADFAEGIAAFFDKREPIYAGE